MISHGFSSGALFLGFGYLYQRSHKKFRLLRWCCPYYAQVCCIIYNFCTSKFRYAWNIRVCGRAIVIVASFSVHYALTIVTGLTIIIAAVYTLCMYTKVFYGKISHLL